MFLTNDELEELTGYKLPAKQIEWLTRNGYPFDVSAVGRAKVLNAYVASRLGGEALRPKAKTPNFGALRK